MNRPQVVDGRVVFAGHCPGCGGPAGYWHYRYPVTLETQGHAGKYATATAREVADGRFRCGGCVHLAAREQRALSREWDALMAAREAKR